MTWMGWILVELRNLMTMDGGLFVQTAVGLATGCAGILIAITGIKMAYGTVNTKAEILRIVVTISLVMSMLRYYDTPVPGIGVSFHNMITDEGLWLAGQIEKGSNDALNADFNAIMANYDGGSGIMGYIREGTLYLAVILAQASLLFIVAFGYIAIEIFVLLGPMFIVGLMFEWSSSYFWSWLRGLLSYSFYPVVANAYVYAMARFFTDVGNAFPFPWTAKECASILTMFVAVLVAFTFGIFKVPSLVSHLFSGGTGEHSFPGWGMWR